MSRHVLFVKTWHGRRVVASLSELPSLEDVKKRTPQLVDKLWVRIDGRDYKIKFPK